MHHALAPGVIQIATTRRDNAFLVEGDDGYTLIDVGWASAPTTLLATLADLGRKPTDIRRIVITHAHPDHVQGAARLRTATGARLLIHAADAPWLEAGQVPPHGRSGRLGRLIDQLPKLHWTPTSPDAHLTDGEHIERSNGLRVIHTPGHTPGHIALHHEPTHTALLGDALFNRSNLTLGPAALAADPALRSDSLHKLPSDLHTIGFAHGAPLTGSATDTFHEFLRKTRSANKPA
ncbi:MBL fold metallo-hydrolase [Streptomyces chartreusis]|uniref:MBL fold metallo-hydrolase n=1 Tax=Streptomyces chartreusis TaxID=1969 RepID=UPI0036406CD2